MDRFLGRIDIIAVIFIMTLFMEGHLVVHRIVTYVHSLSRFESEGFKFAIVLHFVAVPWVSIRTEKIVTVVGICIAEIKISLFDCIQVADSYSDPGG